MSKRRKRLCNYSVKIIKHTFRNTTTTKEEIKLTDMSFPSLAPVLLSELPLALFCLTWNPLAHHPPQHTHASVMIHMQKRHLVVLLSENEKELQRIKYNRNP